MCGGCADGAKVRAEGEGGVKDHLRFGSGQCGRAALWVLI